ncbi:MAG: sterol desaturase family protein [Bacteriovoracaceae bacterium]
MSSGLEIYLLFLPFLFLIMGLEVYFLLKKKQSVNKHAYVVNIISSFAMGLIDILVMTHILGQYKHFSKISLFIMPNTWFTHVLALLTLDFVLWCSHYLGHKLPFFWSIHGVHHQPEEYNLSVGLRQPWIHKAYSVLFYWTMALIGVPLEILQSVYSLVVVSQFWTHTTFIPKEIPVLSWILMTPSQHRVHHGRNEVYIDKNFGLMFSLWDRLFKTYHPETEAVDFGTNEKFEKTNGLWANLFPLILFIKKAAIASSGGKLFAYLIGRHRILLNTEDPYRKLIEEKRMDDVVNEILYSFPYYLVQNILLVGLSFFVLTNPLPLDQKLAMVVGLILSYGIVGLLGDRKVLGRTLELPRILSLIYLCSAINEILCLTLLVVQFVSFGIFYYLHSEKSLRQAWFNLFSNARTDYDL